MRIQQISVFLENKQGRLENLCQVLADANVNIDTITITETAEFGIIRLIVEEVDRAVEVLKAAGFSPKKVDVLAIEVEDAPGGLCKLLQKTRAKGMNVEYIYALMQKSTGRPVMVMSFKDLDAAEAALND